MTNERGETSEIWLRGNLRPVAWLALVEAVVAGGLIAAVALRAPSLTSFLLVAVPFCGIAAGIVGVLAYAAARPRLERVGGCLRVRLSPTAVEDVPLDAVECFFQGSNPIGLPGEHAGDATGGTRRRLFQAGDIHALGHVGRRVCGV
jgi:hypothetical protein